MPHESMDAQQVARYLHMDEREVVKLALRGQIPCRKVQNRFVFRKGEVDHWVEERIHTLTPDRLAKIEKGVSAHHGFDYDRMVLCPLIPEGGIEAPLVARTRDSVIRELVGLAERTGLVHAREDLIREIVHREELCSTGLVAHVAIPHPRSPLPYDITESFVVVGLTPSGVPYGSQDGSLTRLFFLVCGKDEQTHLHVLARLGLMLHDPSVVEGFLHANSPEELREALETCEASMLDVDA